MQTIQSRSQQQYSAIVAFFLRLFRQVIITDFKDTVSWAQSLKF